MRNPFPRSKRCAGNAAIVLQVSKGLNNIKNELCAKTDSEKVFIRPSVLAPIVPKKVGDAQSFQGHLLREYGKWCQAPSNPISGYPYLSTFT